MGSISESIDTIVALTLGVASSVEAAPTLPEGGCTVPLLQGYSSYSETTSYVGRLKSVVHSLKVVTPKEYELPDELLDGLDEGFVALVFFSFLGDVTLGWSQEAGYDRALRLVSCSVKSGSDAAAKGCKEWLFESTDGVSHI